ncbi:MAG: hypothetical protein ACLT2T_15350 [Bilophila wadsworthia]
MTSSVSSTVAVTAQSAGVGIDAGQRVTVPPVQHHVGPPRG